jgi:sulfite reductase (ferredoxin)
MDAGAGRTGAVDRRALAVRDRIVTEYVHRGLSGIPPDDCYGRLRWWGLHVDRCPGAATSAGTREDPGRRLEGTLRLRLRVWTPRGEVPQPQLRALAAVGRRYSSGAVDVVDGHTVQLHGVRIQDVPAIWGLLEPTGWRTRRARVVSPSVLTSPAAGVDAEEVIDPVGPANQLLGVADRLSGTEQVLRRLRTAIAGTGWLDEYQEGCDLGFVGSRQAIHGPGFEVRVGGRHRHPQGRGLGAWVPAGEIVQVWLGMVRLLSDYRGSKRGSRRSRVPVTDWSPARFREVLEREYLGHCLLDGPSSSPRREGDLTGVHRQSDGGYWVGAVPVARRMAAEQLPGLVSALDRSGCGRVQLTAGQHLAFLDVPGAGLGPLLRALSSIGLVTNGSEVRRSV